VLRPLLADACGGPRETPLRDPPPVLPAPSPVEGSERESWMKCRPVALGWEPQECRSRRPLPVLPVPSPAPGVIEGSQVEGRLCGEKA
jgi:hypothetical protein